MAVPIDWDFSTLPDVVWVNVMSRLELEDRNSLSRTCRRLNAAFQHPSLWHTVRIVLLCDLDDSRLPKSRLSHGVIIPERYKAMILAFGAFFQDLELILLGYVREIQKPCEEVIAQLAKSCRLQSLTLDIGEPVNLASNRTPLAESHLKVLGLLISQAFRLKSLTVNSWPIYPNHNGFDLLHCMRENEQIQNLEKLRLFEKNAEPDTWFPRNICLPSVDQVQLTVSHFKRLTSVGLHADLLTESLTLELSNLKWFRHLSLLLIQSSSSIRGNISSSAWKSLISKCPSLKVSVTVGNTLPSFELFQFFKLEIPLTSVSFSKHSRYQPHIVENLSSCYANTLTTFQDFGDGLANCDSVLLSFVARCKQLNHFVYHGQLTDSTILALAELRRQEWSVFQVKIQSQPPLEDDDESQVIGVTSAGNFYVKAHQPESGFYYTDESQEIRSVKMELLANKVSMALQTKWMPIK